jgi:hypothetical protein
LYGRKSLKWRNHCACKHTWCRKYGVHQTFMFSAACAHTHVWVHAVYGCVSSKYSCLAQHVPTRVHARMLCMAVFVCACCAFFRPLALHSTDANSARCVVVCTRARSKLTWWCNTRAYSVKLVSLCRQRETTRSAISGLRHGGR